MKILRTAVLGCGDFAHRNAQNCRSLNDDIALIAFSDHHIENARTYSEKYGNGRGAAYTDHHELIDKENLDLLIGCLPPFAHSDEVQYAAQKGVHLLMEKPIALTSEQAWQMVEAVEQAGVKSQVGFMFRFGEAVEELKSLIETGAAGKAGVMAARYFCNSLHATWWRQREKSGGQLVEQIIHIVDLMRYLLGEPTSVYSRQENLWHQGVPDYTIEDVSATVLSFQSGALGMITATNGAIPNRWISEYQVVTQKITAEFANANNATFHFTDQENVPTRAIASTRNIHLEELRDLVAAIRTGNATRTPMREGAKSLELVLAARRSAEERKEIWLK